MNILILGDNDILARKKEKHSFVIVLKNSFSENSAEVPEIYPRQRPISRAVSLLSKALSHMASWENCKNFPKQVGNCF